MGKPEEFCGAVLSLNLNRPEIGNSEHQDQVCMLMTFNHGLKQSQAAAELFDCLV